MLRVSCVGVQSSVEMYGVVHHCKSCSPLIATFQVGDNKGMLNFEAYFDLFDPLWLNESIRTSNVHHCKSMVTSGCP